MFIKNHNTLPSEAFLGFTVGYLLMVGGVEAVGNLHVGFGMVLVLAGCFLLSGCGSGSADAPIEQSDLTRSQTQWRRSGIRSYRYTLQRSCFCLPTNTPVVIEVRDGVPFSIKTPSGDSVDPTPFTAYDTIDEIFIAIQSVLDTPHGVAKVTYNALLGYPLTAVLDPLPDAVDDELALGVTGFQRLD